MYLKDEHDIIHIAKMLFSGFEGQVRVCKSQRYNRAELKDKNILMLST